MRIFLILTHIFIFLINLNMIFYLLDYYLMILKPLTWHNFIIYFLKQKATKITNFFLTQTPKITNPIYPNTHLIIIIPINMTQFNNLTNPKYLFF